MSARGKSINLFLMDGDAGGRIRCTLANWTGVAYKILRTEAAGGYAFYQPVICGDVCYRQERQWSDKLENS